MPKVVEGRLDGRALRVGVVVARFNEFVTRRLLDGAVATLIERGVRSEDILVAWVPGSFEIGGAAKVLLATGQIDGVIGLGAVIRGETSHYDHVCQGTMMGILQAGLDSGRPVIFGVLTVDTVDQAQARAGADSANKGHEAALTVIEMIHLYRSLASDSALTSLGGRDP